VELQNIQVEITDMDSFENLHNKIISVLENQLPNWLTYHNAAHTQYVLDKTIFIAQEEHRTDNEIRLLKYAALFHDTGYLVNPKNHEEESCKIAERELAGKYLNSDELEIVCNMIMATKLPQTPQTHLEEILADADLEYLGTESFEKISEGLYMEILSSNGDLSLIQWYNLQISFMSKHQYFTSFCRKNRESVKLKNIEMIKENLSRINR
jgi:Uncharacterized protein conserved in bacteria